MPSNSHRYRKSHSIRDETCEKIHAAIRRLHELRGWGRFSRLELAKQSGVSTATVYAYAGSLIQLTLHAYDEECQRLIDGCQQAKTPHDFFNTIVGICEGPGQPIARALNPATVEPWQENSSDTPDYPLSFESLAMRLGELIEQSDAEGVRIVANDRARATLYALLSAIVVEDYGAIGAIEP